MAKDIKTLPTDIYNLFLRTEETPIDAQNMSELLAAIQTACIEYLQKPQELIRKPDIRLSKIGTRNRKLWYETHYHPWLKEKQPHTPNPRYHGPKFMRFFAGTIWEAILLFLAREAGHAVSRQQEEVLLGEVPGHLDAFINEFLTDVKTASHFGYSKFETLEKFEEDDAFGYLGQLSAYKRASNDPAHKPAYFWAFNKSTCEMTILEVPANKLPCADSRLEEVKRVLALPNPPKEKCWEPVPEGKSGNMKLHKNCSFCEFKDVCWADANGGKGIRRFQYSSGVTELVHVYKEPTVDEVFY